MRIIKILSIFLIGITGFNSNAQTFGLKAGLNLANMLDKDNDTVFSKDYKIIPGLHFGVFCDYPLNDYLSIESSLIYTTKGFEYEFVNNGFGVLKRTRLHYLEIPISIKVSHEMQNGYRIFGTIGPYISAGLNGKVEKVNYNNGKKITFEDEVDFGTDQFEDEFRLMDWGMSIGGGIEISKAVLGLSYDYGLENISNSQENGTTAKNRVVKLSLGFIF